MRCGGFARAVIFVLPVICDFGRGYKKSAHKSGRVLIILNEVNLTMTLIIKDTKEIEMELKLHINKRLYEKGLITEEMYIKAKKIILTG